MSCHLPQRMPLPLNPHFKSKYSSAVRRGFLHHLTNSPNLPTSESTILEDFAKLYKLNYIGSSLKLYFINTKSLTSIKIAFHLTVLIVIAEIIEIVSNKEVKTKILKPQR